MNAFIREDIAKVLRKHGTIFHVLTQRKGCRPNFIELLVCKEL